MSNYIEIISREEIMQVPLSITLSILIISILIVIIPTIIAFFIIKKKKGNIINSIFVEMIFGCVAIIFSLIANPFINKKYKIESTGEYNYTATIDLDKITVSEYNDFIKEYQPKIIDDIYYFKSKNFLEVNKNNTF